MHKNKKVDYDHIVALYRAGQTVRQIKQAVGCADMTVRKVLRSHGLLAPAKEQYSAETRALIMEEYRNRYKTDMNNTQIREKWGVSIQIILEWIRDAGLSSVADPDPVRIEPGMTRAQIICMMSNAGYSRQQIADREGITAKNVSTVLSKYRVAGGRRNRAPVRSDEGRISLLKSVQVGLTKGHSLDKLCAEHDISTSTYYVWLRELSTKL